MRAFYTAGKMLLWLSWKDTRAAEGWRPPNSLDMSSRSVTGKKSGWFVTTECSTGGKRHKYYPPCQRREKSA